MINSLNFGYFNERYQIQQSLLLLSYLSYNIGDKMKKDPSLQGGFVQIYQAQLKMIIRSQSLSFQDDVMLRIFKNQQGYKLQLTSELNISFFYIQILTPKQLSEIVEKKMQNQSALFGSIFAEGHKYTLDVRSAQSASLLIEKQQKFKSYQLATFEFLMENEQMIRESLSFRYQRMKIREKMLDNYWENMCNVIKTKNPSILLQLEQKYKKNAFR